MIKQWLSRQQAKKSLGKGLTLMSIGKPELAIAEFEHALALDDNILESRLRRGVCYVVTLNDEQGLADLNKALFANPTLSAAYYWIAVVYLRRDELSLALDNIERALQLDPNEPANYLLRVVSSRNNWGEMADNG